MQTSANDPSQPTDQPAAGDGPGLGVRFVFDRPEIPPNTGNAIRLAACTGAQFHIAGPTKFEFSDANLRRAGLDYHDLAWFQTHENLQAAFEQVLPARVFAFTSHAPTWFTEVDYQPGDVLLFGPESTGLSDAVLADPRITQQVRIPMLPGRRSLNLANAASIALFEAWRQLGFEGAR